MDSASMTVQTNQAAPTEPRNLTVELTSSTVVATWDTPLSPNGIVMYIINITSLDLATGDSAQLLAFAMRDANSRVVVLDIIDEPHVQYIVSVWAMTGGGVSGVTVATVTSNEGVSTAPGNLMTESTNVSVSVTWSEPGDANGIISGYNVIIELSDNQVASRSVDNTTLTIIFENLEPFTNYTVSVRATTGSGSILGDVAMENVTTAIGIPTAPLNVTSSPRGVMESLTVSWVPPEKLNSPSLVYMVSYRLAGGAVESLPTEEDQIEVTIPGLLPFKNYSVMVEACSSVGCGPVSMEVTALTLQGVPSAPQMFSVETVTNSSSTLTASWIAPLTPNGIILGYNITCTSSLSEETIFDISLPETMHVLMGLEPFTNYTCAVRGRTIAGEGEPSDASTAATDEDVAERPGNLTAVPTSRSVSLEWVEPAEINGMLLGYQVTVYSGADIINTMFIAGSGTTFNADSLTPFTTYRFDVAAVNGAGVGGARSITIATLEDAPSEPRNVGLDVTSSSTINVTWLPPSTPNGDIRYYNVSFFMAEEGVSGRSVLQVFDSNSAVLTGLLPYNNYSVFVEAFTVALGPPSTVVTDLTLEDAPSAPVLETVSSVSSSVIFVSWSPPLMPNGVIRSYQLTYNSTTSDPGSAVTLNTSASASQLNITGLLPFTSYTVVVAAVTVEIGMDSAAMTVQTDEAAPSSPRMFSLATVTSSSSSLTASWLAPVSRNGILTDYTINCTSPLLDVRVFSVTPPLVSTVLTGLDPYTNYTCDVRASTSAGESSPSNSDTAVTDENIPGSVVGVSVLVINSTSVMVSWDTPTERNGIILHYSITITVEDDTLLARSERVSETNAGTYSLIFANLTPFTRYLVMLSASTRIGAGPNVTRSVVTDPSSSSPPTNFTAEVINSTAVLLRWEYPSTPRGDIAGYIVDVDVVSTQAMNVRTLNRTLVPGDTQPQSVLIDELQPFTNYSFTVSGYSFSTEPFFVHEGEEAMETATTEEAAPTMPRNFVLVASTAPTELTATWEIPSQPNGVIVNYTVICNDSMTFTLVPLPWFQMMLETQLTGLRPFTMYVCSVFATTRAGTGPESATSVNTTEQDVPSEPLNFNLVSTSSTSLLASWDTPDMTNGVIQSYTISCNAPPPLATPITFIVPGNSLSYNLTDLRPFTNYTCQVMANTSAGEGNPSNMVTRRTDEDVPSEPLNFDLVSTSSTSLSASWNTPNMHNGVIQSYTISCNAPPPLAMPITFVVPGNSLSYNLTDLRPFTNYTCQVTANTSAGEGNPSNMVTRRTDEDVPGPVLSLTATALNSTAVEVSWAPPSITNGVIVHYNVTIFSSDSLSVIVTNTDIQSYSLVFSTLIPFTEYTVRVTAATIVGEGEGMVRMVRTDPFAASPPVMVVAEQVNSTSIRVRWGYPAFPRGEIVGYIIEVIEEEATVNVTLPMLDDRDNQMKLVTGLAPNTIYSFRVRAYSYGTEPFVIHLGEEGIAQERTNESVPSAPTNFTLSPVRDNSSILVASWSVPDPANGVLLDYTVTCNDSILHTFSAFTSMTVMVTGMLSGLRPYTVYLCSVVARTSVGVGDASNTAEERTAEDIPSAPRTFTLDSTSSTSIGAMWVEPEFPNGVLLQYNISCTTAMPASSFDSVVDGSILSTTLTGLNPFTNYTCLITASTSVGPGDPSNIYTVRTNEDVPSEPLNFDLVSTSSTSLSASWGTPDMTNGVIQSYTISCNAPPPSATPITFIVPGNSFSYLLTNLKPFTFYTCQVTANTSAGEGNPSNMVTRRTDEDVPSEPLNFDLVSTSSTSLSASWGTPDMTNGVIQSYTISCNAPPSLATPITFIVPGNSFSYSLTDLKPFTNYTCQVTANTSAGEGNPSNMVTRRTDEDIPSGPPRNLSFSELTSTSFRLSWLPPLLEQQNGILLNYTVSYVNVMNSRIEEFVSNTSVLLEGLQEFTVYCVTVNASTVVGVGPGASLMVLTLSAVPGRVTIGEFVVLTSTSLSLSWLPLEDVDHNGIITGYILNLTSSSSDETNVTVVNSSTTTMYNFTGLTPYTNYSVQVAAINMDGSGPLSLSRTARTLEGVPGPVLMLEHKSISFEEVSLTWAEPDPSYGNIANYTVTYSRSSDMQVTMVVTSPHLTLTDLVGNSMYVVIVYASTIAGPGTETSIEFTTSAGPPVRVSEEEFSQIVPKQVGEGGAGVTPTTIEIEFEIIEEQQVNGDVRKYLIIPAFADSSNNMITTYYESINSPDPNNRPPYRAIEKSLDGNRRKRQTSNGGSVQRVTLGSNVQCGPQNYTCNGPLLPDTSYMIMYTLFTDNGNTTYSFPNTFKTSTSSGLSPGASAGVGLVAVLIVLLLIALVLFIVYYIYKTRSGSLEIYKSPNKKNMTLLTSDDQPRLEPTEHTIVPLHENMGEGIVNQKFQLHHSKPHSRRIYLKDFEKHLQYMLDDSMYKFSEEYERITEIGLEHSKEASLQADNRAKNRYTNILAYDHSRVKLSFVDDDPGSDYINACYIPGYRMRRAYIATQGPLPSTFDDFWRMVWEQNTHNIVMLTQLVERGRTKCHRYWPGSEPMVYGEIEVEMQSEKEKEDWIVREFKLSIDEKRYRIVRHFQFSSWPDHGVPDSPVAAVDFVKNVRCYVDSIHGPIVVHCSAGVGRTGCFVALDTLMLHIKEYDWVDIFGLACEMRQHRNHMIQTEAQYVFIHKALLEVIEPMTIVKNGTTGSHYSTYNMPIFINRYTEPNDSQMTDYFGNELSITEETHV